jgi:hypothetical protein
MLPMDQHETGKTKQISTSNSHDVFYNFDEKNNQLIRYIEIEFGLVYK